jgi:hypothetical protein
MQPAEAGRHDALRCGPPNRSEEDRRLNSSQAASKDYNQAVSDALGEHTRLEGSNLPPPLRRDNSAGHAYRTGTVGGQAGRPFEVAAIRRACTTQCAWPTDPSRGTSEKGIPVPNPVKGEH